MMTATQFHGTRRRHFGLFGVFDPLAAPYIPTRPRAIQTNSKPPAIRASKAASAWSPWATASYGGLCIHPATGEVREATTGGDVGGAYGGLAPPPGLPMCPIQMPPVATNNNSPANGIIVNDGGAHADTPEATFHPADVLLTPPRKWVPWAIGGGILATIGAAAVALTHR